MFSFHRCEISFIFLKTLGYTSISVTIVTMYFDSISYEICFISLKHWITRVSGFMPEKGHVLCWIKLC